MVTKTSKVMPWQIKLAQGMARYMLDEYRITLGQVLDCMDREWAYSWQEIAEKAAKADYRAAIFSHCIENMDEAHVDEMFKPILAEYLAKVLGAKEVKIKW